MNIAYIIDLNGILKEEDMHIPYLDRLYYYEIAPIDLSKKKVLGFRDEVMSHTTDLVNKHLYFFVIKNEKNVLSSLSSCLCDIQNDHLLFNREKDEMHVICNFIMEESDGFNIVEYQEQLKGSLTRNDVCVYSWFLDKYDQNGDKPLSDVRRAHAIARFVGMLSKHYGNISTSLVPMTQDTETAKPIFNFFGDACVFFDEEKRNDSVRNYYCFKNIQHLLNIPDRELDEYLQRDILPHKDDKKELDKRIDATSEEFLKQQRVPIEASLVTEKTQGLLLKSSDEDEEYLVDAADNKLVFLEELRKSGGWQLENMDMFLTKYQAKVGLDNEIQETVSNEFLDKLYNEKYIIHERNGFDNINNIVSNSRRIHIEKFKKNVDNHLNIIFNQQGDRNYVLLQEILCKQETNQHCSNINNGIAFMEYLGLGKSDYLIDKEVSMGDINLVTIKDALEKEETKRHCEYETKKNEITEKYTAKENDQSSKIMEDIDKIDERIKQCRREKRRCDFQIDHWIDEDADKKLTARTRLVMDFGCGVLAAIIWIIVSLRYLSDMMSDTFEHYGRYQWEVFGGFALAGIVVGAVIIAKALRCRREAEEALELAQRQKRSFMNDCVREMEDVTKKHYEWLLAYHGLKTMRELIGYVAWKKDELVNFRKTLFRLMLHYKLTLGNDTERVWNDDNTIELKDRNECSVMLFGPEGAKIGVRYCFAQDGNFLSNTFDDYKRKKSRWETSRSSLSHTSWNFDQTTLEKEVIACMKEHEGHGLEYTALKETSVLPTNTDDVEMEDIHQGYCGDCYFMATLAAIAKVNPEYIVGKNGMVEDLGDEHRFFRVKFYDKDGKRVNVDVDNRFWNQGGQPYYAGKGRSNDSEGSSYDPWVMAVEKAWAKANDNGYDGIEGGSVDGKECVRKVEYSFAVTGKSAFYCMTKNVPDRVKLLNMMKKHFLDEHLPITLYSAHEDNPEFRSTDSNLVNYHAYALKAIYDDDTFDIFNPWNSHAADENVRGKHYERVDIDFIRDNFEVVVFFGIKESDFDSFERDLTQNAGEEEVTKDLEKILHKSFDQLTLAVLKFEDLLAEDTMRKALNNAAYLFNNKRIADHRGSGNSGHLMFVEACKSGVCDGTNREIQNFLNNGLSPDIKLQELLFRYDDKLSLTLLKLSPHYVLENFK